MSTTKYTARLAEKYKKEVIPALVKKFGYKNHLSCVVCSWYEQ